MSASKDEREAALDAFAASLLLPEEAVRTLWERADGTADPRRVAIKLAYRQGLVGPTRAQELLHGTVTDLPAPETLSFEEIAADLAPL